VWDINIFIDENSIMGELLKTLFGYNGNPSLTEMIGYFGYLITVTFFFTRTTTARREVKAAQPQA
jgi:high-affinity iron transporter